jgi:hypothetical protein
MADIFLSYARADRERAKQIAEALEEKGWTVWWDVSLVAGDRYRSKIAEQLRSAKCVVVLWSQQSIESDWVIDEAEDGKRRGVLVQALIDDVSPPHGFRQIQAAKLIEGAESGEFVRLSGGIGAYAPLSSVDQWRSLEHRFSNLGDSTLTAQILADETKGIRWSITGSVSDAHVSRSKFLVLADEAGELLLKSLPTWPDEPSMKFPNPLFESPESYYNYWLFSLVAKLISFKPIKDLPRVSADQCAYFADKEAKG